MQCRRDPSEKRRRRDWLVGDCRAGIGLDAVEAAVRALDARRKSRRGWIVSEG